MASISLYLENAEKAIEVEGTAVKVTDGCLFVWEGENVAAVVPLSRLLFARTSDVVSEE